MGGEPTPETVASPPRRRWRLADWPRVDHARHGRHGAHRVPCHARAGRARRRGARPGRARSRARQPRRPRRRARRRATSSTGVRCGARCSGVDRVFHVAGHDVAARGRRRVFRVNVRRTRIVLEEALRAGVERVVHTSSVAAIGPAAARARAPTSARSSAPGASACRTSTPSTRPSSRRCAWPPRACPSSSSTRRTSSAAGTCTAPPPSSCAASCAARSPPTSTARCASSTSGTSRAGTCSPTSGAWSGERYILGNRNFTLDRLFADLGRMSGVEPPAVKLPVAAALAVAPGRARRCPAARSSPRTRCASPPCGGPSARPRPSGSSATPPVTTRTRSSDRSPGTASASGDRGAAGLASAAGAARRGVRTASGGRVLGRMVP